MPKRGPNASTPPGRQTCGCQTSSKPAARLPGAPLQDRSQRRRKKLDPPPDASCGAPEHLCVCAPSTTGRRSVAPNTRPRSPPPPGSRRGGDVLRSMPRQLIPRPGGSPAPRGGGVLHFGQRLLGRGNLRSGPRSVLPPTLLRPPVPPLARSIPLRSTSELRQGCQAGPGARAPAIRSRTSAHESPRPLLPRRSPRRFRPPRSRHLPVAVNRAAASLRSTLGRSSG
mmetsp:Transcript_27085/g.68311  ORF Transcript_27085/g.68311 Transcript_27085/m.68311 type:complete len:226 (+) Transcript_27085:393-1070(+)